MKRNKNIIHVIKEDLEGYLGKLYNESSGRSIGNQSYYKLGFMYKLRFFLKSNRMEVYKEGEWVVFGIPLKNIDFSVVLSLTNMFDDDTRESVIEDFFRSRILTLDKPSEEEMKQYLKYADVFMKSRYGKLLLEDEEKQNDSNVTYSLGDEIYKKFKRRDIFPILCINFDNEKLMSEEVTRKRVRHGYFGYGHSNVITNTKSTRMGKDFPQAAMEHLNKVGFPWTLVMFSGMEVMGKMCAGSIVNKSIMNE